MPVFILTWNPSKWAMPESEYNEAVTITAAGGETDDQWRVGNRTGGIGFGDYAYLLRQHVNRGIVGAGYFTSEVYQGDHWDGSGREANYARVAWTSWLPVDDRLPTEVLKSSVPGVAWDRIQGSGVQMLEASARGLDELWADHLDQIGYELAGSPEEVRPSDSYREGSVSRVEVNRYERNPKARAAALALHGRDCVVCGFSFEARYGDLGADFTQVHHLRELSSLPKGYKVNPETDLVPVCANCHAMLHRRRPALTPDELRNRLQPDRP